MLLDIKKYWTLTPFFMGFLFFFHPMRVSAQQERVLVLGLKGAQAISIRHNIAQALSKHPQLEALTLADLDKPRKVERKQQNIQMMHEQLSQAKKHYYALEYKKASEKLQTVIENYEKDHLYTQETVSGLMAAFFYLALTQLELGEKTKAQQSMLSYNYIKYGVDDGNQHTKELSKKKYSPKVQDLYKKTLKMMNQSAPATINFVSYKPVTKIWINGQAYPVQDLAKIKLFQGSYYIYSSDQSGLPLYSAQVQLQPGSNVLSLKQPIKSDQNTANTFKIDWDKQGDQLYFDTETKKVLSELAMRYNIAKFALLNFDQQKVYISFFDHHLQKQTSAFEVKQIDHIVNYYQQSFGAN
ncbi:MAG TPA: hypothetical protein PKC21_09230 [Oligoflexia bacterium]|nr:hypothetical protein [Oligoflexia bacterium]HMR25520.1 hypothetical protein [Oligoflexia bacterium]